MRNATREGAGALLLVSGLFLSTADAAAGQDAAGDADTIREVVEGWRIVARIFNNEG